MPTPSASLLSPPSVFPWYNPTKQSSQPPLRACIPAAAYFWREKKHRHADLSHLNSRPWTQVGPECHSAAYNLFLALSIFSFSWMTISLPFALQLVSTFYISKRRETEKNYLGFPAPPLLPAYGHGCTPRALSRHSSLLPSTQSHFPPLEGHPFSHSPSRLAPPLILLFQVIPS